MKVLILLSVFIASALSALVCFPTEFTTHEVTYEPIQLDQFIAKAFFSLKAKKYRIDFGVEIIDGKYTPAKTQFLFDYPKGVWYNINFINGTGSCKKAPLNGTITAPCLSRDARHRGTYTLGGVLQVENYIEVEHGKNGRVRLDIAFCDNINVPIRVTDFAKGPNKQFAVTEYWNFEEKVHHDNFVVPSICQGAAMEHNAASTIGEILRAEPKIKSFVAFD